MLVEMYMSGRKIGDALRVFDEMSVAVVTGNMVDERVREVLGIFCEMLDNGVDGDEGMVRGRLDSAFLVFEDTLAKNVFSWKALISGLAFNGNGVKGLALFDEMVKKVFKPNESTFVGVLTCCVYSGLVQRCKDLFSFNGFKASC
nr:pentatricopeptide repeat-containing protein At1g09190 [Tanacetum cinerariifolium]